MFKKKINASNKLKLCLYLDTFFFFKFISKDKCSFKDGPHENSHLVLLWI